MMGNPAVLTLKAPWGFVCGREGLVVVDLAGIHCVSGAGLRNLLLIGKKLGKRSITLLLANVPIDRGRTYESSKFYIRSREAGGCTAMLVHHTDSAP